MFASAVLCVFGFVHIANAQSDQKSNRQVSQQVDASASQNQPATRAPTADDDGQPITVQRIWRVGAVIQTKSRTVKGILVTFPIPTDWPEQHVNLYKEEIPDVARRADFRVSDGVKQMVATMPSIPPRQTVSIYVLMEITVSAIPFPDRTDHLVVPNRPPRDVRAHLNDSPLINHRKIDVKRRVNEIVAEKQMAWAQVQGFYDWIRANIEVRKIKPHGAVATIKKQFGAPEDLTNLFIAMCRNHKVPARTVWADNGEYAEFYLQDDEGEGRWYPAILFGKPEFGQMSDPRVIIQKGDNVKVPEKKQRQRLVTEHLRGSGSSTEQRPIVRFVRDLLPSRDDEDR